MMVCRYLGNEIIHNDLGSRRSDSECSQRELPYLRRSVFYYFLAAYLVESTNNVHAGR